MTMEALVAVKDDCVCGLHGGPLSVSLDESLEGGVSRVGGIFLRSRKVFFLFQSGSKSLTNVTFSGPLLENFGLESALPKTQADISAIRPSLLAKKKCSI